MKIDQMSKGKQVMFFIAVALTTLISDAMLVYQPILNNLYEAFPEQMGAVNLFVSLPAIVLIVASLVVPPIVKKIGRKTTLLLGTIIGFVSGVLMAFMTGNIYLLLIFNIINAVAQGLINVSAVIVITDYIFGEKYRARITGWYVTAMSLVSAVLSALSGAIATHGWKLSFQTYWLFALPLILVIFFVPSDKAVGCVKEEAAEEKAEKSKKPLGARFIIFAITLLFFWICNNIFIWYYSFYVSENNLGSEAFSGTVGAIASIASMVFGIFFGTIMMKLKKRVTFICCLEVIVGLLLMMIFPSPVMAIVGAILVGNTTGLMYAYSFALCPAICPEEKQGLALAIVSAVSGIGGVVVSYIVTFGMNLFGSYTKFLIVPIIVVAVIAVIDFIASKNDKVGEM